MTATDELFLELAKILRDALRGVYDDIAELRDGFVDMDHSKASRLRVDQLESRVDNIEQRMSR